MFERFSVDASWPDYYYGTSFDTLEGEKTEMSIDILANPTLLLSPMRINKDWDIDKMVEIEVYL